MGPVLGLLEVELGAPADDLAAPLDVVLEDRLERQRLGLAIHHISNAGTYDKNPGTELVTVQYSYPLDKLCNCK